ncbi:capsular polysaccharide transport system permease protein [Acinetobacter calcoaceticus]|uniref:Capsular polysaccharide transport system permease protein n=1 Tax=Acinetobacter calcoaceticus TaxID=471 RepID=A0A4R1XWH2_ACICA|nr:capsular polysaccharide transport system permease protein [Acinetobacter calcoaceticus]
MQFKMNKKMLLSYSSVVLLPLLVTVSYLGFFAHDRFQSASVLLVKQVGDAKISDGTGLGALLGVANTSGEDSNILKEYIGSRDMVEKLNQQLNLHQAFAVAGDPIFSLPQDATIEELVKHYNKLVKVNLDEKTMMLSVSSQGFSPDFSLKLNKEILLQSDAFINSVSRGIALEQQSFAEQQLQDANEQLKKARNDLLTYQNENRTFDPETQARAVATLVAGLQSNLAQLRTEERTLLSYLNAEASQVVAIRSQIASVQKQIEDESAKLTSPSNAKLNKTVADFEELKGQVTFATDLYKISLGSLEKSRIEAAQKLKKLVIISEPRLAQDALYPRRVYIGITTFLVLNIIFAIGLLIHSIIREHRE